MVGYHDNNISSSCMNSVVSGRSGMWLQCLDKVLR